jgi:hypothetical protein
MIETVLLIICSMIEIIFIAFLFKKIYKSIKLCIVEHIYSYLMAIFLALISLFLTLYKLL